MKQMTKEEIISQYETSGEIMFEEIHNGDWRKHDREGAKLLKIFKMFEKNPDFAMECIDELLKSKNVVVRSKGAAYCLALKRNIETGVRILEEISRDPSYRLYRLNAEMTLKVWREKGELQLYQKKQQHN
jgi:hypothetical protein